MITPIAKAITMSTVVIAAPSERLEHFRQVDSRLRALLLLQTEQSASESIGMRHYLRGTEYRTTFCIAAQSKL